MGSPPGPVEGIVYGLPSGPRFAGAAAPRMARRPARRLRHATAPRSPYRIIELAQRVRLPPRCRRSPPLHTCLGGHIAYRFTIIGDDSVRNTGSIESGE